MAQLLVSVRDQHEARQALAGGADIIDVKEPANGPLGAASVDQWWAILETLQAAPETHLASVALGELTELVEASFACRVPPGFQFAKIGLAGCACRNDWRRQLEHAVATCAPAASPVAVVYADWQIAQSPPPEVILEWARQRGCRWVLVDTFDKRSGTLLQKWTADALRDWICRVADAGMQAAVAGSITIDAIEQVLSMQPDVIAVRGAVCRGTRVDAVEAKLVSRLRAAMWLEAA